MRANHILAIFIIMLLIGLTFIPLISAMELNGTSNVYQIENAPDYYPLQDELFTAPDLYTQDAVKSIITEVSEQNLKSYITTLQNFGSRLYRAPGMFNASIWLHDMLKGNGRLEVGYHNFTIERPVWGTFTLSNVILTLPGLNASSDRIYYMFAHSDAVQFTDSNQWLTNTPGADDDASGCAAILETARIMSRYKFQDTIKFAFFNAEEIGLVGSERYAANMSVWGENVIGSIDYDMIGYSSGSLSYDLDLRYNPASAAQGIYEVDVNDRYQIGLTINAAQTSGGIPSDIQSFYDHGFPGVFAIEYDFSPYYHTTSDLVKYLNMTLVSKCTKLAVASLSEMARLMYTDPTIAPNQVKASNAYSIAGEMINISVNVTNTGNLDTSNAELVFSVDGEPFYHTQISVPAYGFNTTNATWNTTLGSHNITVTIDPKNEIIEANETNNFAWIHILVNDKPNAILTAIPLQVYTYEPVLFNGSNSYDIYGGVDQYNISFGDDNYTGWSRNRITEYSYPDDGKYFVSLIVKDIYNETSKPVSLTLQVLNRPPMANPSSNLTETYTNSSIQFYANATDLDGIVTVKWKFGEGSESTELNPIFSYNTSGQFKVELQVIDDDGAIENYNLLINIKNRPHDCILNVSPVFGNITTKFLFKYEISDVDSYDFFISWEFGDSNTWPNKLNSNDQTHLEVHKLSELYSSEFYYSYNKPGIYNIIITVKDEDGGEAIDNVTVTVLDIPPTAVISAVQPDYFEFDSYDNIYFDGRGSFDLEGPIFYFWDFDDGNTSQGSTTMHSYSRPGNYNITLKVTDNAGQNDITNISIKINNQPPTARFKTYGNHIVYSTLLFDGSQSSDPEGVLFYYWDFGDNKTSTNGPIVDHVYNKPGVYTVKLTVTDEHGKTAFIEKVLTILSKPNDGTINNNNNTDGNKTDSKDDNKTKSKTDEDDSWIFYILFTTNIIFIILFILFLIIFLLVWRKQKKVPGTTDLPETESRATHPELLGQAEISGMEPERQYQTPPTLSSSTLTPTPLSSSTLTPTPTTPISSSTYPLQQPFEQEQEQQFTPPIQSAEQPSSLEPTPDK